MLKPNARWIIKTDKEPLATFRSKYRSISKSPAEVHDQRTHLATAALKSLGMIPRSPSPSPILEHKLITKEDLPEPTPNIVPNVVSPAATPRPNTASPVPLRHNVTSRTQCDQPGLTKKDMLILIKHYRGSSEGLEGLPEKELSVLLSSYRVSALGSKLTTVLT